MRHLGIREWLAAGQAIARRDLLRDSGPGQYCTRFEAELCRASGAKHALLVNSGTSALTVALAALGVGPGDEVIVPAYTWMSTAAAPLHLGAVPVLANVDATLSLCPASLQRAITPQTRAIVPVHMNNRPCNMQAITRIAAEHGLLVVEDACQSIGIRYRGQWCGTIGDAGAFSFNQHKNMTIGEGGAVLLRAPGAFSRAYNFHDLGVSFRNRELPEAGPVFVGMNLRATEIAGAMMRVQLRRLPARLHAMERRWRILCRALERGGYPLAPCNDPENSRGLIVTFASEAEAARFAGLRGVTRLHDSTKHVFTNWAPVLQRRMFHPAVNPWANVPRPPECEPKDFAATLDLLRRSCRVGLGENYPLPVVAAAARQFNRPARSQARRVPQT